MRAGSMGGWSRCWRGLAVFGCFCLAASLAAADEDPVTLQTTPDFPAWMTEAGSGSDRNPDGAPAGSRPGEAASPQDARAGAGENDLWSDDGSEGGGSASAPGGSGSATRRPRGLLEPTVPIDPETGRAAGDHEGSTNAGDRTATRVGSASQSAIGRFVPPRPDLSRIRQLARDRAAAIASASAAAGHPTGGGGLASSSIGSATPSLGTATPVVVSGPNADIAASGSAAGRVMDPARPAHRPPLTPPGRPKRVPRPPDEAAIDALFATPSGAPATHTWKLRGGFRRPQAPPSLLLERRREQQQRDTVDDEAGEPDAPVADEPGASATSPAPPATGSDAR